MSSQGVSDLRITSDWSEIDTALEVLERSPTAKSVLALDLALKSLFEETQAAVHVITGSLKSSGKTTTGVVRHTWVGEISYGGPSKGIHNPVKYASLEQARDGSHDFMALVNEDIGDDMILTAMTFSFGASDA